MTRGTRIGEVTREQLIERLGLAISDDERVKLLDKQSNKQRLLEYAAYLGIVTDAEVQASRATSATTLPSYLYSHVKDATLRSTIDDYVVASSRLQTRGSRLANYIAMGRVSRDGDATSVQNRVAPPTRSIGDIRPEAWNVADFVADETQLKHCFLPERWALEADIPDGKKAAPRHAFVIAALEGRDAHFAHLLPDWRAIMSPTGWDNPLNRMASKYYANVQVMVRTSIVQRIKKYLHVVKLDTPGGDDEATRKAIADTFAGRLRPLAISDSDFSMLHYLRSVVGFSDPECQIGWLSKLPTMSRDLLALFLHVSVFVEGSSMLPVAPRGRKYAYLDDKTIKPLLADRKRWRIDGLRDVFDVTRDSLKWQRVAVRRRLRRKFAKKAAKGRRIKNGAALKKWKRIGHGGKVPKSIHVASVETDGVGLRMCIQVPIPFEARPIDWSALEASQENKKISRKRKQPLQAEVEEVPLDDFDTSKRNLSRVRDESIGPRPVFGGGDTGRAKLFAFAIDRGDGCKPDTLVFTRRQYYHEMGYFSQQRWEAKRRYQVDGLDAALSDLSACNGSLASPRPDVWDKYVDAERTHSELLDGEYVVDKGRALWKMRMFRFKRSSLDRAVSNLIKTARRGDNSRTIVLGIGDGGFPSTGPGELAAPTAALTRAFVRAKRRHENVELRKICEFRTTLCCCACGAVTEAPTVVDAGTGRQRRSRRVRACRSCAAQTPFKLRDRDVQASRNILLLTMLQYYGLERPVELSRKKTKTVRSTCS